LCKGCWPSGAESAVHHCLVYLLLLVLIKVSCWSVIKRPANFLQSVLLAIGTLCQAVLTLAVFMV